MCIYLAVATVWGTADAEVKHPSVEYTEVKGSPFKAWSRSEYIYSFACAPSAKDFFLVNFYPSDPFTCIFSKTSPEFFLLAVVTPVPVWTRRVKQATLLIVTDDLMQVPMLSARRI